MNYSHDANMPKLEVFVAFGNENAPLAVMYDE